MSLTAFWRVFRYRNFTTFAFAQTVSQFGDRLNNMALLGLIGAHVAQSPLAMAVLAFFAALPVLVAGPVPGLIVDRWSRKWVMVGVDGLRALVVLAIPFVFYATRNFGIINIFVFLTFLLGAFFNSAKMAALPNLVGDRSEILEANAVANFIGRFATVLGLLFGGIIVEMVVWQRLEMEGWAAALYLDAGTYALSALVLATLTIKGMAAVRQKKGLHAKDLIREEAGIFRKALDDLGEAFSLIRRRKVVGTVFISLLLLVFFGSACLILVILLAQQVLGYGTKGVGILGASTAVGLLVGAYLFGVFGKKIGELRAIFVCLTLLAGLLIAAAFITPFKLFAALFFVGGLLLSPVIIAQDTLFHRLVPEGLRGRIFAAKELVWNGGFLAFCVMLGVAAEALKRIYSFELSLRGLMVACGVSLVLAVAGERLYSVWSRRRGKPTAAGS